MANETSIVPPTTPSDRESLERWRRQPGAVSFAPLLERYGSFVYSSAYRCLGGADRAAEATRAVFLVLARRARRLRRKIDLAGWLFQVTGMARRKLGWKSQRRPWWARWKRRSKDDIAAETPLWAQVAPELEAVLSRLPARQREAVLVQMLFNGTSDSLAQNLLTSERRAQKRLRKGWQKLARHLGKRGVSIEAGTVAQLCTAEGCALPLPEELSREILASIDKTLGKRPPCKLARRILSGLAWVRWRRRVVIGIPSFVLILLLAAGTVGYIESRTGYSRLLSVFIVWSVKHEGKTVPGLAEPAKPWPADATQTRLNAAAVRTERDIYQTTNVWLAHLKFAPDQWAAVQPKRIEPLPHFFQPDGTVLLRHPEAQRSGLAGVLGFDFHWGVAALDFGGLAFTNVAVRLKGNGTFLSSLYGDKRSFKVDLNKFAKGQKLGAIDELAFNNLVNDHSCLSDTLAYEFFRDAGVPASRTAYAYLSASVPDQWEQKPLGLYLMVEAVDENFVLERFGSPRTPLFKPVTYELFKYLGDDWTAYQTIYDLKTKATPAQQQRVIDFARLVTEAEDVDFRQRLKDFLDLKKFARYLACEVFLSNYDSFLSNGQNFYLYLDPDSNRFGFIPWDLDLSWGGFFLIGTTAERENASIWHPWVGRHRFLERVMAVEAFRKLYRAELEDLYAQLFVSRRLFPRIDDLARVLRSPLAAESPFRLGKFEEAVSGKRAKPSAGGEPRGANRPAHQIKRFIEARAKSVRQQLDGKSQGVILERGAGG